MGPCSAVAQLYANILSPARDGWKMIALAAIRGAATG
jgi:hypothetical protein